MRPDAVSFSPRNGNATSFDPYTAIVPHQKSTASGRESSSTLSDRASVKSIKETPQDMIMHENIKGILHEVAKLEERCNGLDTANKELRFKIALLEADHNPKGGDNTYSVNGDHYAANGTQHAINDTQHGVNGTSRSLNGDFTGYESSRNGSEQNFTTTSETTYPSSVDMTEVWRQIKQIREIQIMQDQRIATQSTQTYELDQRFQRKDKTSTWLQGRIGKLENDFKELDNKVDDIEVDNNRGRSLNKMGGSADVGAWLVDEIQKTQMTLANLTTNCEKGYEELEGRCKALAVAVENAPAEPRPTQWLTETSSTEFHLTNPKASKRDVVELKEWQRQQRRKAANEKLIDDASTRDALYAMFFQLGHIMTKEEDETVWWEGSFEATSAQAFQLRGRVIRRLALFDLSDTALQEAKAQKGFVDW